MTTTDSVITSTTLHLASITYWAGGFDHVAEQSRERLGAKAGSWERLRRLPEVIADAPQAPHVIFFQQANHFDLDGGRLMHETERLLAPFGRYRGYLTRSDWNITHDLVLVREPQAGEPPLWVRHHWTDHDAPEPRNGYIEVQVGDDGPLLWLRSVMLYPWSGDRRIEQMRAMLDVVPEGRKAILAGSFNHRMSGPHEIDRDWEKVARLDPKSLLHKGMQLEDGTVVADTRGLDEAVGRWSEAAGRRLRGKGWYSLGDLDGDYEPTTHHEVDTGGPMRINHFLTNWRGALVSGTHRTHRPTPQAAKRHRMITVSVTV